MPKETRAIILRRARRLFVRQGFTATSIRQLAEDVGIGKATIYHHFNDKQAIVVAMLDKELVVDKAALSALQAEPDPHHRIEKTVHASLDRLQQSIDLIQVIRREVPAGQARLDAGFHAYWDVHIDLIAGAIEQGQAMGIFRDMDAAQAAQVLIVMIFGLVNSTIALGTPSPTPEEGAAMLLDIFWRGIEE